MFYQSCKARRDYNFVLEYFSFEIIYVPQFLLKVLKAIYFENIVSEQRMQGTPIYVQFRDLK